MTNKSRTIFRIVRLFGSDRDARARGRVQRAVKKPNDACEAEAEPAFARTVAIRLLTNVDAF